VLVAACSHTHTIGTFVHSVAVVGNELVVERCILEQRSNAVSATSCTTEHHALPSPTPKAP
jgi:hypothetical protein